jgi:hypothetical protein
MAVAVGGGTAVAMDRQPTQHEATQILPLFSFGTGAGRFAPLPWQITPSG